MILHFFRSMRRGKYLKVDLEPVREGELAVFFQFFCEENPKEKDC